VTTLKIVQKFPSALAILLSMMIQAGCAGLVGSGSTSPSSPGNPSSNPTPAFSIAPVSLNFGSQPLNTPTAAQILTLYNGGKGTLTIGQVTVTGTNSADFSQTNTCPTSPTTLASGGS
jgi:hypothetical protein